jgi:hypothetical protein
MFFKSVFEKTEEKREKEKVIFPAQRDGSHTRVLNNID